MKKQKAYQRPKRTTFVKLFAQNMVLAVLTTGIFAKEVYEINANDVYAQIQQELNAREITFLTKINNLDNSDTMNVNAFSDTTSINAYLSMYTYYSAMLGNLPSEMINSGIGQYAPEFSENCHAISVIVDENKHILYSNKERLVTFLRMEEDSKNSICTCELENIPEICQAYQEMQAKITDKFRGYVDITVSSVYVDIENHKFIPHEAELSLEIYTSEIDPLAEIQILETKPITIDFHDDDYELINLKPSYEKNPPYAMLTGFYGINEQDFNEMFSKLDDYVWAKHASTPEMALIGSGMRGLSNHTRLYYTTIPIWINGQKNYLTIVFQIDVWNEETQKLYFTAVGGFFLLMCLLALLWSLHKHKINRIAYQFEDYQRTLTNNLAHDLKTPLTAINGYAENLLTMYRMEEQPRQYLEAVLENVNYTDSIINKTLELNKIQEIRTLKKSKISLRDLTEQAVSKYQSQLDEHDLTIQIDGDAQITANPELLSVCIENLVSNAAKYAAGEISVSISKNKFEILNDVTSPADTANLLMPFVKGDKARNDKSSSGLGLSIAQNAAEVNGFRLEISSEGNQFKASILL